MILFQPQKIGKRMFSICVYSCFRLFLFIVFCCMSVRSFLLFFLASLRFFFCRDYLYFFLLAHTHTHTLTCTPGMHSLRWPTRAHAPGMHRWPSRTHAPGMHRWPTRREPGPGREPVKRPGLRGHVFAHM